MDKYLNKISVAITKREDHKMLYFTVILMIGAILSMGIHFFPQYDISYVLCPWIYMPCFLYVSRRITKKRQFALWSLFWIGSFVVRYYGFLAEYSQSASITLEIVAAIIYMLPFWLDKLACDKNARMISLFVFPLANVTVDYILELTSVGSLFSLASTQFDNKTILQVASLLGGKGIVFVITLFASFIVYYRKDLKKLGICVLCLMLVNVCGFIRIQHNSTDVLSSEKITIGWSGETIQDDSFFADTSDGTVEYNIECLTKAIKEAKEKNIDFLVFPEEAFYVNIYAHDDFIYAAEDLAAEYEINLLLPIESDDPEDDSQLAINHCIYINQDGETIDDYVKSILIPFAEEPYYLSGNWDLPDVWVNLNNQEIYFSYAICFDGDSSSYIRTMPDHASLFIDVSWDWDAVDDLHYRIIGCRAVENGLTVVKPTVCGYTTVTDCLGNVHSKTHSNDTGYSGVNVLELPTTKINTIYHRFGSVIDNGYLISFVVVLLFSLVFRREKMETKKPLTRFGEFEFLKAAAIVGLPLVHIMEEAIEANMASPALMKFGYGIIGLCAFGPSVFMICMGFGIGGGKTSAKSIRNAGIQFLLIGALLNIVRWFIPGVVQMLTIGTRLIDDINFCLQSDIYYFVGIFYIFYSILKKYKVSTPRLLLASIIMLTVNNALTPIMQKYVTNEILISLVGNIIYVDETSCFPLLSWAIFPTVGIILGEVLKKRDDEFREVFMRRMLDFSVVFLGAFSFFLWKYDINVMKVLVSPLNDYVTDLPNVLMLLSLALFLIGLVYYLCKVIGNSKFMAFVLKISVFIIPFYLLQWVIIAWMFYATAIFKVPSESFGILPFFISVVLVTGLCIYTATEHGMKIMKVISKYTTIKKKHKKKVVKTNEK